MSTTTLLEAAAGFLTATTALWFVVNAPRQGVPAAAAAPVVLPPALIPPSAPTSCAMAWLPTPACSPCAWRWG